MRLTEQQYQKLLERHPHLHHHKVVVREIMTGKRIRQNPKPLMNKLEQEYYDLMLNGAEYSVDIQALRFKLGNGIWYKPDFVVWWRNANMVEAIEVKGPHAFRGGLENLKVAATTYKHIRWKLVWKDTDGGWTGQLVLP